MFFRFFVIINGLIFISFLRALSVPRPRRRRRRPGVYTRTRSRGNSGRLARADVTFMRRRRRRTPRRTRPGNIIIT